METVSEVQSFVGASSEVQFAPGAMNVQEIARFAEPREVMRSSPANSTLTDEHLLASRAKSRCSNAFRELYESHRPKIYHSVLQILGNHQDTEDDDGLSTFLGTRARLFGIAYRFLKSSAEAEDLVQDVWIRWQTTDRTTVRDAAAFLTTMTARLAINVVRSARSRRETSFGSSLKESVDTCPDPQLEAERSENLQSAVVVLLEKLSPIERAAYVLREAFDYSYREIANILRLEEANSRQLVTRARQHVVDSQCSSANSAEQRRFLTAFLAATQKGALTKFESFLVGSVDGTVRKGERPLRTSSTQFCIRSDQSNAILCHKPIAYSALEHDSFQIAESKMMVTIARIVTSAAMDSSGQRSSPTICVSVPQSAYAGERADLMTHCEQLRAANSELHKLRKEFEDDLLIAARVQRHLEPKPIVWGPVRVDTFSRSARTVGGDFGMVCPFGDQHLNLLLGDVSGHGISAALAASHIYNETSAHLQTGVPLGDVLSTLNSSVIRKFNSPSFFFTVAAARFDRSGRHMVFAGAGHPPCMVIKPGGNPQLLEARSIMLGALPNAVCHEPMTEIDLEPGDRILLYTDGITEVFDDRGEMLGVEGLQNFVRECSLLPFDDLLPAILERIASWRVGPFVDDVTLVLAEVLE